VWVAPRTYYIGAVASTVPSETGTNTNDNSCTSTTIVTITAPPGQPGTLTVDTIKTAVISGPDPPFVGSTTVYELAITVSNTGGSDVTNVVVHNIISFDVTFLSVGTPSQGSVTAPPIAWNVGKLTSGPGATLTFRVAAKPTVSGLLYLNHKEHVSASGTTLGTLISDTGNTDVTAFAILQSRSPIGGVWVPIDKFQLLAPWTALFSLTTVAALSIVYLKHKRKQQI